MEQYEVVISERAYAMLGAHVRFLSQINVNAAEKLKDRVIKNIILLENAPKSFPFFEADYITPNKYHVLFVEKWFLILYQIKDHTVFVDYIIDGRQDYEWLFK